MMRTLNSWWDGHIVGDLTQNQHGELGFTYAPDWLAREDAPALSASLEVAVQVAQRWMSRAQTRHRHRGTPAQPPVLLFGRAERRHPAQRHQPHP